MSGAFCDGTSDCSDMGSFYFSSGCVRRISTSSAYCVQNSGNAALSFFWFCASGHAEQLPESRRESATVDDHRVDDVVVADVGHLFALT